MVFVPKKMKEIPNKIKLEANPFKTKYFQAASVDFMEV